MNRPQIFDPARAVLDSSHLLCLAGELDVAGDGFRVLAGRATGRRAIARYLARASTCYGAAHLLRKIAE